MDAPQDVEGGLLLPSLSAPKSLHSKGLYHRVRLVLDVKQHYYLAGTHILLAYIQHYVRYFYGQSVSLHLRVGPGRLPPSGAS